MLVAGVAQAMQAMHAADFPLFLQLACFVLFRRPTDDTLTRPVAGK